MEFLVVRLGTVGSTQDELRRRVHAGEDVTGLCLRAEAQSSGRGRRGSAWTSPPGGSYQSVGIGRTHQPWLTLAIGVGISAALRHLPGSPEVLVKWPNDLFLGEDKLGGILTEVVAGQVLVGVGVNVSNPVPPGSSRLPRHEPDVVSDAVLSGILDGRDLALEGGGRVKARFQDVDMLRGREVEVSVPSGTAAPGSVMRGVGLGIDDDGALLLRDPETGEVRRTVTGHVMRYGPGVRADRD